MGWFGKKGSSSKASEPLSTTYQQHTGRSQSPAAGTVPSSQRSNYVAPPPVEDSQSDNSSHDFTEDMVMISKEDDDTFGGVEENTSSFTRNTEVDADQATYEGSMGSHIHSLFNGHLMKWKFEAEEGACFLRVPAYFGALGMMVTAVVAVVLYPAAWEPHSIVMTVGVMVMAIFILLLEGRFVDKNPLGMRAHLRNIVTRNFNILRFVWGRGLLYIIAGVLNIAQTWLMTMISGAIMVLIGLLSVAIGIHCSRKFSVLRNALTDDSFLLLLFTYYDTNSDGYLEAHQFARLLSALGMELDDRYTLKAFNVIDSRGKRKITFDDFSNWWHNGFVQRGRKDDGGELV